MRPALVLLLPVLLTLSGCFESYEGSLSATPTATTVTWSVADGMEPTITFRIANDDLDDAITQVKVRVRVEVTAGGGLLAADEPELVSPPSGVTGSAGDYLIARMEPGSAVTLNLRALVEPGTYRWTVSVDPEGDVEEFTESDNTAVTIVTVTQPPLGTINLAFDELDDLTASPSGELVELEVPIVVTRANGQPLPLLRVYVDSQGTDSFYAVSFTNIPAGPSILTLTAFAPAGGAGLIRVELDPTDFIVETDEDDNVLIFEFPLGGSG